MKKLLLCITATVMTLLCACGASTYETSASVASTAPEMAIEPEMEESYDSMAYTDSGALDIIEPNMADNQKIIYNSYIEIETKDYETSIKTLETMLSENGGFIENSYVRGNEGNSNRGKYASYTLRIPSESFAEMSEEIGTLGNVISANTSRENVTSQYIDIESRLSSYEVQEQRLLELLEVAENLDDMLTIEGYLSDVRYNIEYYTTEINTLDSEINYCTIEVEIREVVQYAENGEFGMSFTSQMGTAIKDSFAGIINLAQGLILFVLNYWYGIAIIVFGACFIRRKIRKTYNKNSVE